MNKKNFVGWKSIFSFTVQQMTTGVAFKAVTTIVAILLIAGMIIINIVMADRAQEGNITIEKVFVLDESGLSETPFQLMLPMVAGEKYSAIKFETVAADTKPEDAFGNAVADSSKAVLLHITKENNQYAMGIGIPRQKEIKESEAKLLLNNLVLCFKGNKLTQIGLTGEQLNVVTMPVKATVSDAGEPAKSIGEYIIEMIAPMALSMVLYLMIFQYGGNTCSAIVTEKTSKLIEQLLTSVQPVSLIMGKVLASTCVALLQLIIWIFSGVLGYVIGDKIALSMYPGYENPLYQIFDLINKNTTQGVFSIQSIILAIIILCFGFFFYNVIAGGIGSVLSKPEQVATGNQIFAIPLMIAWMIAYFAAFSENDLLINVVRLVPFTAPFIVPAELIIGSVSIIMGCITLLLQVIVAFLFVIVAGRLYKGLLLYNGTKLTSGKLLGILIAKNTVKN